MKPVTTHLPVPQPPVISSLLSVPHYQPLEKGNPVYAEKVRQITSKGYLRLLVIPLLVAFVVFAVIPGALAPLFGLILPGDEAHPVNLASAAAMWVSLIGGGYLMIYASKLSWERLGFNKTHPLRDVATGIGLGLGLLIIVAVLIRVLGGTTWSWVFGTSAIGPILVAIIFFAAQGTWEELIYRGYLMPFFSKLWNDKVSIIATGLMFAAGHAFNPGMTAMPVINLVIFGFVFGLLYYRSGSLWVTGAAHAAWNFSQGFVFGAEVSGNETQGSFLKSIPVEGHQLISGASFGFEGSIITSIAGILIIIALTWGWPRISKGRAQRLSTPQ